MMWAHYQPTLRKYIQQPQESSPKAKAKKRHKAKDSSYEGRQRLTPLHKNYSPDLHEVGLLRKKLTTAVY